MIKPVLSSPNLENLVLSGYWFDPPRDAQLAQLSMLKLRHAHFNSVKGADAFWFLWNINAPELELESLSFRYVLFGEDGADVVYDGGEEFPGINALCAVRTLVFDRCRPTPGLVPYISQLCPFATHLSVIASWSGNASFKDFVDPEKEPIPWLKLNAVSFIFDDRDRTQLDSLEELLIWLLIRRDRLGDVGVKVLHDRRMRYRPWDEDDRVARELLGQLEEVVERFEYVPWKGYVRWPPYNVGFVEVDGEAYVDV